MKEMKTILGTDVDMTIYQNLKRLCYISSYSHARKYYSLKRLATFDFLGFTHYWAKSRRGYWVIKRKRKRAKVNQVFKALYSYCRFNRHQRVGEQWKELCLKIKGYYAYFAIPGNFKFLQRIFRNAGASITAILGWGLKAY